jgi:hypothetical protein
MLSLSLPVVHFAWVLAITFSCVAVIMASAAFLRRAVLSAVSRRSAKLHAVLDRWIDGLLDGSVDYAAGLRELYPSLASARRAVIDRLPLAEDNAGSGRLVTLRRLCTDLGLVDRWRRQLTREPSGWTFSALLDPTLAPIERMPGFSFVARAEAAEKLGRLRDEASWSALVSALDHPRLAVRSAAAQALGRIRAPSSFPMLARKLQDAALGRGHMLSVRTLKMALTPFPLACASHLAGMLQHPHPRVRFLAADLIAAILQRAGRPAEPRDLPHTAFPGPIAEIFLSRLRNDPNPDARARAADVIARLDDVRADSALAGLLEDTAWFVRLHAVRALAQRSPAPLEGLVRRLTDARWQVREAAAQALAAQGPCGANLLFAHFGATDDRYSREQVVEQVERAGLIPSLVEAFGGPDSTEEAPFMEDMLRLGRTTVVAALQNARELEQRA